MQRLNEYFSRNEFACQCGCGFDTVDIVLLEMLTAVREYFDAPVTITSGCRCETHNARCKGAKKSKHLQGRAADFKVVGHKPKDVYAFLTRTYPDMGGIILYPSWVHVDSREYPFHKGE